MAAVSVGKDYRLDVSWKTANSLPANLDGATVVWTVTPKATAKVTTGVSLDYITCNISLAGAYVAKCTATLASGSVVVASIPLEAV